MASAKTIRNCSQVILVVNIIASVVIGGIIADLSGKSTTMKVLAFVVIVVGIFIAEMLNALFIGFADIIDNTYTAANGKENSLERGNGGSASQVYNSSVQPNNSVSSSSPQNKGVSPSIGQKKPVINTGTSDAWYCRDCGQRNLNSSSFCNACGQKKMIM